MLSKRLRNYRFKNIIEKITWIQSLYEHEKIINDNYSGKMSVFDILDNFETFTGDVTYKNCTAKILN